MAALDCHLGIDYQTDFVKDLCADVKFQYDVDYADVYHVWEDHKRENILTFRDQAFVSKFTCTLAPLYHTTFMKAFDDSLRSFVNFDKIE